MASILNTYSSILPSPSSVLSWTRTACLLSSVETICFFQAHQYQRDSDNPIATPVQPLLIRASSIILVSISITIIYAAIFTICVRQHSMFRVWSFFLSLVQLTFIIFIVCILLGATSSKSARQYIEHILQIYRL